MSQLFVISAPSGAGKTSLVRALLGRRANLVVSVSHTTRPPRPHELEGRDYHFVSVQRFEELVAAGAFLEHARVFDNYYGTGAAQVRARLDAGTDVILEIDWQGARQVRSAMPACVSVFILPPSREALQQRLHERRTDSAEVIERRLRDAVADMQHYREFDFVVVNDRFEQAAAELESILDGHGEALRADRAALAPVLQRLLG
ncbi:MAG TPA: guanylate kinase [Steroidobacteraceae bacterium]|jgi:guanylate kinase